MQPGVLSSCKYSRWHTLLAGRQKSLCFPLWKSLTKFAPNFMGGVHSSLGDESSILFWHNNWLLAELLVQLVATAVPPTDLTKIMQSYWTLGCG